MALDWSLLRLAMNRDKIKNRLLRMNLKQYPPHVRTIRNKRELVRVAFPWVSIGYKNGHLYAFFHNRKWRTLDEAVDVLRTVPEFFHPIGESGKICLGETAKYLMSKGMLTPEQAFWMTRNMHQKHTELPLAMRMGSPEAAMQEEWKKPNFDAEIIFNICQWLWFLVFTGVIAYFMSAFLRHIIQDLPWASFERWLFG